MFRYDASEIRSLVPLSLHYQLEKETNLLINNLENEKDFYCVSVSIHDNRNGHNERSNSINVWGKGRG
ncbi:hypothetical protein SDC9_200764 [bioreactor metagenome]|uniref:Uncharacterized protein n=1 Tax=bioreactor metagenome TaxID=1076179 RepID=A0A645IQ02_9ZZZZ